MAAKRQAKQKARKDVLGEAWRDDSWIVKFGKLVPPPGRPRRVKPLFRHVAEKIPYDALSEVWALYRDHDWAVDGVYVAHDSMGFARYVGRGHVFRRLRVRRRRAPRELQYFSFYIVHDKSHEREIETLLIRLGGAHLHFNTKKKRVATAPGNVRDYEAGTRFVERRRRPGRGPA